MDRRKDVDDRSHDASRCARPIERRKSLAGETVPRAGVRAMKEGTE